MAIIVPTILAETPADYAERIKRVKPFAKRLHVDVCDGLFADNKTIGLTQIYDIENVPLDLHLMLERPSAELETIISLAPSLVIIHFEAHVEHATFIHELKACDIKVGLAILPTTTVDQIKDLLPLIDHLLIFTGHLGHNGGTFDAHGLDKFAAVRALAPTLEIGVDGGIDRVSAHSCVDAGVNVLDVGSFIHNHGDPQLAFALLSAIAEGAS